MEFPSYYTIHLYNNLSLNQLFLKVYTYIINECRVWGEDAGKVQILYTDGDDTLFFLFLFLTFIHLISYSPSTPSTSSIRVYNIGIYIVKDSKIGY